MSMYSSWERRASSDGKVPENMFMVKLSFLVGMLLPIIPSSEGSRPESRFELSMSSRAFRRSPIASGSVPDSSLCERSTSERPNSGAPTFSALDEVVARVVAA
eukprot:1112774-Prymnesium_polylepis.1